MSSHESRWLIHPLCGVLGTRRKQLGQYRQQYQQDGDQCTGAGRGTRSRAGWVLQHAHHPGPGPVVGQGGDACHLAHEVVDIHDSDGSGSEVGFEIRSEGQEDAPHGSELVVVSVPAPLPAFWLAGDGAVHPEWKRLSILSRITSHSR